MNRTIQTSFTSGMLDPSLQQHIDLVVYRNGAKTIRNCRIRPQGGVSRRSGSIVKARIASTEYQIEPFVFSGLQAYVFLFRNGAVDIWDKIGRVFLATVPGPWTGAQIAANELRVSQQLDKMTVSHKDFETRVITRTGFSTFLIDVFPWAKDVTGVIVWQPYQKYAPSTVKLGVSATAVGAAQAVTTADFFVAGHVGLKIRYRKKQITINNIVTARRADVTIDEELKFPDGSGGFVHTGVGDYDWDEQAFSPLHGYARCFCLHLQRQWVGGGRDCPNTVWGTSLDDPYSMNLGTGLPTDAIKYSIYAERVAEIVSMVSNGFLQIFTSHAEFYVPKPDSQALTPASFSIEQQSRYGSANMQARQFDQTTVFVTAKAQGLREFMYEMLQGSFSANALTFMSKRLLTGPIDLDVQMEGIGEEQECRAYITNEDGTIAVLTKVQKEQIAGWSYWDTQGLYKRLGVIDSEVWTVVEREVAGVTSTYLEIFDQSARMDFSASMSGAASTTWGPFPLHVGATVHVRSGDLYLGELEVDGAGMLSLPLAVTSIEIGYNFVPEVVPLQSHVQMPDGITMGEPKRYVSVTAFVNDTLSCRIKNRNLPTGLPDQDPSVAPPLFTGKFKAWLLGWGYNKDVVISSPYPLPFELNSLVTEVEV